MTWDEWLAFICARRPGFREAIEGVPAEAIALCEAGLGIRLPRFYVDFLLEMGVDGGEFYPFGRSQCSNFHELVEELPADDYPTDRYFKVSFETDESLIIQYDYYLDLSRSDGHDAPLVRFEGGALFPFDGESDFTQALEVGRTLVDSFRACIHGVGFRREKPERASAQIDEIMEVLARMNLSLALPRSPRLACLRRPDLSAMLGTRQAADGAVLFLAADDRKTLAVALEQITQAFSSACPFPLTKPE